MSFDPLIESRSDGSGASTTLTASRQKRQLVEQAIDAARAADWTGAVGINERVLDFGADSAAENRLAKAYWEQGELAKAREHYQAALALDPTNRIAERNIDRLRLLMAEAGSHDRARPSPAARRRSRSSSRRPARPASRTSSTSPAAPTSPR